MKKIYLTLLLAFLWSVNSLIGQNITEEQTIERPIQVTFLIPPLGINGFNYARCVNNFTINTLIGYSAGVDGIEVGSFLNAEKYFVKGIQMAGFGNVVGTYMVGAQLAGFMNIVKENVEGIQIAGFTNVAGQELEGVQLAGFANVTKMSRSGFQVSGFLNTAPIGKLNGQVSGFANIAAETEGPQISGFMNVSKKIEGIQVAGFANVAKHVEGVQLAGFINICDSIDGIPIAFISIVKKNGLRKFSYSMNEMSYLNLEFHMGVTHFYTIYSFSKLRQQTNRWSYGAGIGTQHNLNETVRLNIEAVSMQELWINKLGGYSFLYVDRLNMLNQLRFNFSADVHDVFSWFFGPTINLHVSNYHNDPYNIGPDYAPKWGIYDRVTLRNNYTKMWIGFNAGIKI